MWVVRIAFDISSQAGRVELRAAGATGKPVEAWRARLTAAANRIQLLEWAFTRNQWAPMAVQSSAAIGSTSVHTGAFSRR